MSFNKMNTNTTEDNTTYPGNEFAPTSFNAPSHQGGQHRTMREEAGVEPKSYITPDGTNLNTGMSSGLGTSTGVEEPSGPTGGNIETFGEGVLPGSTGSMGKHEWTDRDATKPGIGAKLKGQAEVMAGRVTGNPDMVERGQERKAGALP